ncbi:CHAT domain-containing protein [Chryseotalea sanaruensis]|uniref:CHAT domain-containing protein n=1 Tax=Chryseotalea sanaruensis TaxID=2482724 RepID=A0A401UBA3_9BACT|nr:CHAT domain-containing protein [Chryseotalea sanaruensis]GCC52167.1 CHAT domain-containing protein [Chryseotalea sanaruensis]
MRYLYILSIFCFALFATTVFAQDWQSSYNSALQAYNNEDYQNSLNFSIKAYELVKGKDAKNTAYTLQLITANYSALGNAKEALNYAEEEVAAFLQLEGEQSKNYAEALQKQISFLFTANKTEEAYAKSILTLKTIEIVYGTSSYEYAVLLTLVGQISASKKDFVQAQGHFNQAIILLEKIPEGGDDLITVLLFSADLDRAGGAPQPAEQKYKKVLAMLEQNDLKEDPRYQQAKTNLNQLMVAGTNTNGISSVVSDGSQDARLLAQAHLKLAIDFQQKGDASKAIENYTMAKKAVTDGGLEDKLAFSIYLNAGRYALEKSIFDDAQQDIAKIKALSSKLFSATDVEYCVANLTEADYLLETSQTNEAIRSYTDIINNLKQATSLPPPGLLLNSAKQLLNAHQPALAQQLIFPLTTAKDLQEKNLISISILYSEALQQNGRAQDAMLYLKKLIQTPANNVATTSQIQLAEIQRRSGLWNDALSTLKAIQIPKESIRFSGEVEFQKARLYQLLGQYREAEQAYRLAVQHSKLAGDINLLHQINNSLATYFTTIGNYEAAEKLCEELLADKSLDEEFRVTVFQNLATIYQQTLRFDQAQTLLEQVVREDASRLGENDPDYALSLQNLATVYQRTGETQKAADLYAKALAIDAKSVGKESLSYATKAANLGVVQMEIGLMDKALQNLQTALSIRERILGNEHPDYVFNEYNIAVLYQRQQKNELALPLYNHVSKFYINQIKELFPALSEKEKTAYYNKISEVIHAYLDFVLDQQQPSAALLSDLLNFRLATKALLLNSSTKIRQQILAGDDQILKQQFTEWLQTKEALGKWYTQNLDARSLNKTLIENLQQRANELEKQMGNRSSLFLNSSTNEISTWQQINAKLQPNEAAIEMIRLRLNYKNDSVIYAALVIRPGLQEPKLVLFPNGLQMEDKEFKYYRNAIRFNLLNQRSYKMFWQPVEKALTGATNIYFSADGVYNKINLASLYNTDKQQYLIDQYSFALLSNLKELGGRDQVKTLAKQATLLGAPDFGAAGKDDTNGASKFRAMVGMEFQELPGTKVEVERIATLLNAQQWNVKQLLAQEATEEKLKSIKHVGVLHIATHGFFVADGEQDEEVMFTGNPANASSNPLLRSGLILTGAGKVANTTGATEDGILTAYEAMTLPLDKTDIVILSACETGQGEIRNGEGVYGLQRAIMLAGANHLLMSLWKVDDNATQELMEEFYKQWMQSNDMIQSFRNAQLLIKKKYEMPQYWAGFVMVGI